MNICDVAATIDAPTDSVLLCKSMAPCHLIIGALFKEIAAEVVASSPSIDHKAPETIASKAGLDCNCIRADSTT